MRGRGNQHEPLPNLRPGEGFTPLPPFGGLETSRFSTRHIVGLLVCGKKDNVHSRFGRCGFWNWWLGALCFDELAARGFVVCGICGSGICGFAGVCRSLPGANSKMQEYQGKCEPQIPEFAGVCRALITTNSKPQIPQTTNPPNHKFLKLQTTELLSPTSTSPKLRVLGFGRQTKQTTENTLANQNFIVLGVSALCLVVRAAL